METPNHIAKQPNILFIYNDGYILNDKKCGAINCYLNNYLI